MPENRVKAERHKNILTITITGYFDYGLGTQFREAYKDSDDIEKCIIDLKKVTFIDSSALGRLMVLRAWATKIGARVVLSNSNDPVKKVLNIMQFDKLFEIR